MMSIYLLRMHWLKPLAFILAFAVLAHANCAVSCTHSHPSPAEQSNSQASENCHQSNIPVQSDDHESGSACSHSQLSGQQPPITAASFKPLDAVLVGEFVPVHSELDNVPVFAELYGPNRNPSAPPPSVLRI